MILFDFAQCTSFQPKKDNLPFSCLRTPRTILSNALIGVRSFLFRVALFRSGPHHIALREAVPLRFVPLKWCVSSSFLVVVVLM